MPKLSSTSISVAPTAEIQTSVTPCKPTNNLGSKPDPILSAADKISGARNADLFLFNGPIDRVTAVTVTNLVSHRIKRPNIILVMSTYGGDPDAAYLIAKCLQCNYEKFTFMVSGYCKSAGTLVAIGAHELMFSPYGELGPLDIQIPKKDELGGQESGSAINNALDSLMSRAFSSFEAFFLQLIQRSQGQITIQTAAKIAKDLSIGLLSPISQQINPVYVGEVGRALNIALHYGKMLNGMSLNLKKGALDKLISAYPSHSFVIDVHEAQSIFNRVRSSEEPEELLRVALGDMGSIPLNFQQAPIIRFLSSELSIANRRGDITNDESRNDNGPDKAVSSEAGK